MERPTCDICGKVLLDGMRAAWKLRGEPGDWMSLALLCDRHVPKGKLRKPYTPLRCECPCGCGAVAVTVAAGKLACGNCYDSHTVTTSMEVLDDGESP